MGPRARPLPGAGPRQVGGSRTRPPGDARGAALLSPAGLLRFSRPARGRPHATSRPAAPGSPESSERYGQPRSSRSALSPRNLCSARASGSPSTAANSSRGRLLPVRTPIRGNGLTSSAPPFTRPPSCGPTTGPAARRSTVWFTTSVRSSRLCDGRRSALGFDQLDDALDRDERGGCDDHRKGDACSIPDRPPVEGDHGHAEAVRHRNLG